jgi:hypothetical protein
MDTGAAANCMSFDLWQRLQGLPDVTVETPQVQLTSANNENLPCLKYVRVPLTIGQRSFFEYFFVIDRLSRDCIIGYPTMRQRNIDLLNSSGKFTVAGQETVPYCKHTTIKRQISYIEEEVTVLPQTECVVAVMTSNPNI